MKQTPFIKVKRWLRFILIVGLFILPQSFADANETDGFREIDRYIEQAMEKAKIPGLSVVLIRNGQEFVKGYGYSELEPHSPVTPDTRFELASCTKAFTALAIMHLEEEGRLNMTDPLTDYFPGFEATYNEVPQVIRLSDLLYQTSGIPTKTIFSIEASTSEAASQEMVSKLFGIKLTSQPGTQFEYATINYAVLGAVIEQVTGLPYEAYISKEILHELEMNNSTVGGVKDSYSATGYKLGFLQPRAYEAPAFRGNYAAGYIASNATDMVKWLRHQMGLEQSELGTAIQRTQTPGVVIRQTDGEVSSYAMGWKVTEGAVKEISHSGMNPNFSSYVSFIDGKGIGLVVLANSNSSHTLTIGKNLIRLLSEEAGLQKPPIAGLLDWACIGGLSLFLLISLVLVGYLVKLVQEIRCQRRLYQPLRQSAFIKVVTVFFVNGLIAYTVYQSPALLLDSRWELLFVWAPESLKVALYSAAIAQVLITLSLILGMLFPPKDQAKGYQIMKLVGVSLMTGIANAMLVMVVTKALYSTMAIGSLLYYFIFFLCLYLVSRKQIESSMVVYVQEMVYSLRHKITEKILNLSYEDYELLDNGQVISILSDDTVQIAEASNSFVSLITNLVTVAFIILYLAYLAFIPTLMMVGIILSIAVIYNRAIQRSNKHFEKARDSQNVLINKVNDLMGGYKELFIHHAKKKAYIDEMRQVNETFKKRNLTAMVNFINAFLIGELMFILTLGMISIGFAYVLSALTIEIRMAFLIYMLYAFGPIKAIMKAIPQLVRAKVSQRRIQAFLDDGTTSVALVHDMRKQPHIKDFRLENIEFDYEADDQRVFTLGPITFQLSAGEILFLIGGNGSGKTTLAKILTGLYKPHKGSIRVNHRIVSDRHVGELFSVIFSDNFIFKKLYSLKDIDGAQVAHYAELLQIKDLVKIENSEFSSTEFSTGQKKRLALLKCFLENRPIYLFDEFAADQDPVFRAYFYNELLPLMKKIGKIVIAITHDDQYFHIADKIIKLDYGKAEFVKYELPQSEGAL